MEKQKGNTILVLVIIIALLALGFWWFMKSGYKLPQQTAQGPTYQTAMDLDAAAKELDSTDLNQMDAGINQISSDSSSF